MKDLRRCHLVVSGMVQGVFYRASTRQKAQELGLSGWVRNLADGRVEIVAEGAEASVQKLIQWAHTGPSSSRVNGVNVVEESPTGEFSNFQVRY